MFVLNSDYLVTFSSKGDKSNILSQHLPELTSLYKPFSIDPSIPETISNDGQDIGHAATDHVTTDQATTNSTITTNTSCPPNMIYANCSTCQSTCMAPKECMSNCIELEICVCPNGFLLKGDDCVPDEECECFVDGHVIPVSTVITLH